MTRQRANSDSAGDRLLERYADDSMGLPVVLINSAIESSFDDEKGVIVPNLKGLEAALALARITIPDKLRGQEIRFVRKAIGIKAVDLASFLDVAPETISRWENAREVISMNAERILRVRVLFALKDCAPGVFATVDDLLDMKISPVRASPEPITLVFERLPMLTESGRQQVWSFQGVEETETERTATIQVA